jgi:hypothetical protein
VATRACWCRDCQYLSSGNASINAIFETVGFVVTGRVNEYASAADSGRLIRRRFCPTCGTPLFSDQVGLPEYVVVRAGALDDPEVGRPGSTIWTGSAPRWGFVDPGLPACAGHARVARPQ